MSEDKWLRYGIDRDKGLRNCMGKPDFYKKILKMFLQDPCFAKAKDAYARGNQKELFSLIHELKGTSGNAALTDLYGAAVPLVELLRHDNADPAEVDRLFAAVDAAYARASEGIAAMVAE